MQSYLVGIINSDGIKEDGIEITAMSPGEALDGAMGLQVPADNPHGYWVRLNES